MRHPRTVQWTWLACCALCLSGCVQNQAKRVTADPAPEGVTSKTSGYFLSWDGYFECDVGVNLSRGGDNEASGRWKTEWYLWNLGSQAELGSVPRDEGSDVVPFAVRFPLTVKGDPVHYYFTLYVDPASAGHLKLSGRIRQQTPADDEWSLITRGRVLSDEERAQPRDGFALPDVDVDLSTWVIERPKVELRPILKRVAAAR